MDLIIKLKPQICKLKSWSIFQFKIYLPKISISTKHFKKYPFYYAWSINCLEVFMWCQLNPQYSNRTVWILLWAYGSILGWISFHAQDVDPPSIPLNTSLGNQRTQRQKTRAQDLSWHWGGHGWSQHLDLGTRRADFHISSRALCTESGRARLLEFTQWITTITLVEPLPTNMRSLYFKTNRDIWLLQLFFLGGENRCNYRTDMPRS